MKNTDLIAYRRFLSRCDENQKSYKFINAAAKLTDDPEVKKDAELVFKQVAHLYDKGLYDKYYDENNIENPFPEELIFTDYVFPDRLRWAKNLLIKQKAKSILDIGCSDGAYSLNLSKVGFEVTGINLAKSSIELAQKRAKDYGLDATFIQGDFMEYETDKKFDAALLFEIIEHVPDPKKAIEKVFTFLKPDGVCYLSTPNGTADEKASALGVDKENAAGFQFKGHVRIYTEASMREFLADYEILDVLCSESNNIKLLQVSFRRKQ